MCTHNLQKLDSELLPILKIMILLSGVRSPMIQKKIIKNANTKSSIIYKVLQYNLQSNIVQFIKYQYNLQNSIVQFTKYQYNLKSTIVQFTKYQYNLQSTIVQFTKYYSTT